MRRRRAREESLTVLFQADIRNENPEQILETYEITEKGQDAEFIFRIVNGVWDNKEEIDKIIEAFSDAWKVSRMAHVDRNILRIAVLEMLYFIDIPDSVAIDEALEIARKYSNEDSVRFINGILGEMIKNVDNIKKYENNNE